jgi:uncharacterized protein (TIGR03083 family)
MSSAALEAFDDECSAFTGVIDLLEPDDLERVTNCPPWNLHELIVHTVVSIRLPDVLPAAAVGLPLATAADYFRRPERDTDEYRGANVDRTQAIAATVKGSDLHALFVDTWQRMARVVRGKGLDYQIESSRRVHTFESYLLTRIISVAAHGVDAAITLGRDPWTTASALAAIRPVLVDLLGAEPPESLSDQDLLEFGTGRRPLGAAATSELGALAGRFPLLS